MSKSKSNGKVVDEGLLAIKAAFDNAHYLNTDAFDAAGLMMLGKHREQQIPDNVIIEVYAAITEGKNIQLDLAGKSESDSGFVANIESYADMVAFMQGTLKVFATGMKQP